MRTGPEPSPAAPETDRLLLEPLTPEHAPHLTRLFDADWGAVKQTGRMPYPATEAAFREWIEEQTGSRSRAFLIRRRADRAPLGGIGFGGIGRIVEVGYAVGRSHWGRGYATEAVGAMVELAQASGLRGLESFAFVENPASARVLEKAGFWPMGVTERLYPRRGGRRRVRHYMKLL